MDACPIFHILKITDKHTLTPKRSDQIISVLDVIDVFDSGATDM